MQYFIFCEFIELNLIAKTDQEENKFYHLNFSKNETNDCKKLDVGSTAHGRLQWPCCLRQR